MRNKAQLENSIVHVNEYGQPSYSESSVAKNVVPATVEPGATVIASTHRSFDGRVNDSTANSKAPGKTENTVRLRGT